MIGAGFTHLAEVGSTNDWLLARTSELPDGHWVIADRQTAGRGRRGRAWGDGAGNLMASVLVRAEGPMQQLSFVAALALHTALAASGGQGGDPPVPRFLLKWPNDLLLDGLKVSGILLERSGEALVIGLGVNIASSPDTTERPAISLAAAGLPAPAPLDLLARLMPAFAEYRGLWQTQGFDPIRTRWLARAAGVGDRITARLGTETLEGVFEGLEPDGALALRLDDGQLRPVHAGEVFAL
ncbi:biotin--[acetyl-CoA-carboxylase] ligase [Polymorphobacter glacialis]|uniref:biotin--[biotin carboxyl-carrier protein] ligase n=1 Tax=Sandarakinorhabdus glacialis TaxID=1614636 RepID=A0A916ZRG7_9SPHN|nr:biotin--[acetyl-CoA-carboxylase] ligase [Polymorphobacter glacialis]GGE07842.1 biotin--[acetyl-CoA-carboxylase] ligase [Polymorphobacter glacialis]